LVQLENFEGKTLVVNDIRPQVAKPALFTKSQDGN